MIDSRLNGKPLLGPSAPERWVIAEDGQAMSMPVGTDETLTIGAQDLTHQIKLLIRARGQLLPPTPLAACDAQQDDHFAADDWRIEAGRDDEGRNWIAVGLRVNGLGWVTARLLPSLLEDVATKTLVLNGRLIPVPSTDKGNANAA